MKEKRKAGVEMFIEVLHMLPEGGMPRPMTS
jgi:hypothetical protein